MKVLNLYSGLGGNRKLWKDVEVTAVENNPEIAKIYQDNFPDDVVIVGDAHQYLLEHFKGYDFIWSSPPCQTHSSFRYNLQVSVRGVKPEYPDMRLYQEIILLKFHCKSKWVVENVNPYYGELIPAQFVQRHLFWANFHIDDKAFKAENIRAIQIPQLQELHGFDLSSYQLKDKRQVLRNCVLPELGLHIFKSAFNQEMLLCNSSESKAPNGANP
jgi:DNA (cytosine-5)-methyltransferase 1